MLLRQTGALASRAALVSACARTSSPAWVHKTTALAPMARFSSSDNSGSSGSSTGSSSPASGPSASEKRWKTIKKVTFLVGGAAALMTGLSLANPAPMVKEDAKGDVLGPPAEYRLPEKKKGKLLEGTPVTSLHKDATPDLPAHVPYLVIGAGTAAFAAFRAIKAKEPKAKVLLIGDEDRLPYMRPPLSKEMWYSDVTLDPEDKDNVQFRQWNGRVRSAFYEPNVFYTPYDKLAERDNGGVSIVRGVRVARIDPDKQMAFLENGNQIHYDKCLVATGGQPRNLPIFEQNDLVRSKVTLFRTVDDFYKLEKLSKYVKKIAIIGGGYLGSELACALGHRGKETGLEVVQIFPEAGNMGLVLPDYLSQWTSTMIEREGVTIFPKTTVQNALVSGDKLLLKTSDGKSIEVDHAIVAIGIDPDEQLAKASKLTVDPKHGGFQVNAELEARDNIWVAGDAASFDDVVLGRRRVEHHDHAVVTGRLAGENMTGAKQKYTHQSMFWSDLGPDVGYEAIGLVDSKLPTVAVFAKAPEDEEDDRHHTETIDSTKDMGKKSPKKEDVGKYDKGVIFYLHDGVVVGLMMWNLYGRMALARKVLRENTKYDDLQDLAKLFDIHNEEM